MGLKFETIIGFKSFGNITSLVVPTYSSIELVSKNSCIAAHIRGPMIRQVSLKKLLMCLSGSRDLIVGIENRASLVSKF